MREQFLVFRLLLGKACNADCSALKAQWQKSRRAMINTHFSLSWLKLILQKTQMMIFPALPPLHFPNLWRICNPHCSISIFILSPSEGSVLSAASQAVHCTLCWGPCPVAALRGGWGPAPHLKILTSPTRGCSPCPSWATLKHVPSPVSGPESWAGHGAVP